VYRPEAHLIPFWPPTKKKEKKRKKEEAKNV